MNYDYSDVFSTLAGLGAGIMIFFLAIMVFMIIVMWIIFNKAGQPGWAVLIPIFNILVFLRVAGKPWWWIFAFLLPIIPFVGSLLYLVAWIFIVHGISKNFGQGGGFTVGLILLGFIFYPILAFGKYTWSPPAKKEAEG